VSQAQPSAGYGGNIGRGAGLRRWRWPLIIGGPVLILLIVGYFVLTGGRYESTDNAYVQIAKTPVAPSISGRVVQIMVHENERVHRGQVLFRLDPSDVQAQAQSAQAQLAQARQQVTEAQAAYRTQTANVAQAQDTVAYTAKEAKRQQALYAAGVSSKQQVDQAAHAAEIARDQLVAAQHQQAQALAALGGGAGANPGVLQARAELQRAQLNIGYTTVVAPSDGIVARVEQMPLGTYLNASQTAFWLLAGEPWVEANFKEDQLAHMKVGQPVDIRVDAYPDADLHGHVASFAPGTGAAFSALPSQNATGNWVKVTQRLPVRIEFDRPPPGMAARAGLSAKVKVDVRAPGRAR
jgi:membrane fusion protein (multidrug efflux system)